MLDLSFLLLVDHHLLAQILLHHLLLLVHAVDPGLESLLVLLALGELDLDVPQGLLEFLDLGEGHSQLLDRLSRSHNLGGLHLVDGRWEFGSRLLHISHSITYLVDRVFGGHLNSNL